MKIVIQTQHRENYGAHDWDGEGACPQYWKFKGGNTYVVHNVSIEQNLSKDFWSKLEDSVQEESEYFEEYILSSIVVDDCDYDESEFVESWESPINMTFAGGRFLATRYQKSDYCWREGICGKLEQWVQVEGNREEYSCLYELDNGSLKTYQEIIGEAA